jgi:acetylornithine deacetylase/succinyl-diaminopimelate desuccinylase-like protein
LSGDEETAMATSAIIAQKLKNADLVLNMDGGNGMLDEKSGKPVKFAWDGAEKSYADFALTVTNPGGHSSRPTKYNAINQLSAALVRIGQYRFKPELNQISTTWFIESAKLEPDPATAAAMRAFAANPADQAAIQTLSANPALIGKIGTTCVTTMISGGHALNALPQSVTANINCRIFPGHPREAILAELQQVAAEPALTIKDVTEGSVSTDPSPIRKDLTDALEKAVHATYPGVPVFPTIASGASDSMWFRHYGVASYGAGVHFVKDSDDFSHGLDERTPLSNFRTGVTADLILLRELSK